MNEKTNNVKQSVLSAGKKDPNRTGRAGGQFNNKNAEKWTEEEALKLADETIDWLMPKYEYDEKAGKKIDKHSRNVFYLEFFTLHRKLNRCTIDYLCRKYKSFSARYETIKNIQEAKLQKIGSFAKNINPSIVTLILKAKHDYTEKTDMNLSGQISNIPQAQINVINTQVKNGKSEKS